MNRIRSFQRLANSGISSQFQLIKTPAGCLQFVPIERSNLVHGSNVQCCGRLYATSALAAVVEVKTTQRRVSKLERKSMVENYVKRYREMNAGKYPTASDVHKNVGGSYYSIRKFLQELIHCSNMAVTEPKDSDSLAKISVKKSRINDRSGEVIQRKQEEKISPDSEVRERDSSLKSLESKDGLQFPTLDQIDALKIDEPQSHASKPDEPQSSLQPDPENIIKHESVHEGQLNLDMLQSKSEPKQSIESHVLESEPDKIAAKGAEPHDSEPNIVAAEDAEPQQKSSVWHNLRSFANGILGILKRS